MEASGISVGDSLLSISDARIAGKIRLALPYVKEVRVGIKLPGTVNIQIEELEMTYAIQANDSTWWLIAADGRVIEQIEPSAASGYTQILGLQADGPRADQKVQAAEDRKEPAESEQTTEADQSGITLPTVDQITGAEKLDVVLTILAELENNGVIGQIVYLDVSNLNNIVMEYGQRFDIVLGTSENLAYKIAYMAQAITQLPEYETGELDVSFKYSEKALLNPRT
jgi:cell division septal protein FtsQ